MVCVCVGVLRVYTAEEGAEGPHLSPSSSGLFAPLLPRPGTRGSPGQAGIAASPAGLGSSAKPPRLSASSPEAAAGTLGRVSTFSTSPSLLCLPHGDGQLSPLPYSVITAVIKHCMGVLPGQGYMRLTWGEILV